MLAALIFSAAGVHCSKTLTVTKTTPIRVNSQLDEGALFCVESTVPYLTVVFSFTNMLSVRYSVKGNQHSHGSFTIPGQIGGIDFADHLGTLEIESLLGGDLNFSLFAFPERCHRFRYVTTLDFDAFTLQGKFGDSVEPGALTCIWHSEKSFTFEAASAASAVKLCCDTCQNLEESKRRRFSSRDYFVVTPPSRGFAESFVLRLRSVRSSHPLKVSEVLGGGPNLLEIADKLWAEDVPAEVRRADAEQNEPPARRAHGGHGDRIALVFVATVGLIVVATAGLTLGISYCWFRKDTATKANQDEIQRLIPEGDPRRFPGYPYTMPMAYAIPQALPTVYFPPVGEIVQHVPGQAPS
jgi:hypothetical protein